MAAKSRSRKWDIARAHQVTWSGPTSELESCYSGTKLELAVVDIDVIPDTGGALLLAATNMALSTNVLRASRAAFFDLAIKSLSSSSSSESVSSLSASSAIVAFAAGSGECSSKLGDASPDAIFLARSFRAITIAATPNRCLMYRSMCFHDKRSSSFSGLSMSWITRMWLFLTMPSVKHITSRDIMLLSETYSVRSSSAVPTSGRSASSIHHGRGGFGTFECRLVRTLEKACPPNGDVGCLGRLVPKVLSWGPPSGSGPCSSVFSAMLVSVIDGNDGGCSIGGRTREADGADPLGGRADGDVGDLGDAGVFEDVGDSVPCTALFKLLIAPTLTRMLGLLPIPDPSPPCDLPMVTARAVEDIPWLFRDFISSYRKVSLENNNPKQTHFVFA